MVLTGGPNSFPASELEDDIRSLIESFCQQEITEVMVQVVVPDPVYLLDARAWIVRLVDNSYRAVTFTHDGLIGEWTRNKALTQLMRATSSASGLAHALALWPKSPK